MKYNILISLSLFLMCSCGSNSLLEDALQSPDNINNDKEYKVDPYVESLSRELFGTTWMHSKTIQSSGYTNSSNGRVFTFTDEVAETNLYWYSFEGVEQAGQWAITKDGVFMTHPCFKYFITPMEMGGLIATICMEDGEIVKHTSSELVMKDDSKTTYYISASEPNNGTGGSGGSSGGSSGYEDPDVGFYDYTPTRSSLKIQYKIYNQDDAKVSSAKIYYGTSSNPTKSVSATVSGVMITANISGLQAGTTYYVKCVATGKGGTTTTSTTKTMTNY